MTELKTKPSKAHVERLINVVENELVQNDCRSLVKIMSEITGEIPKLWGTSIIGFGKYHYVYESGREGDWFVMGFSPRKQNLTLYIMSGFKEYDALLSKLGKYKLGKSCLYIKKLQDIDLEVLKKILRHSMRVIPR
jgi:hypothetical protein